MMPQKKLLISSLERSELVIADNCICTTCGLRSLECGFTRQNCCSDYTVDPELEPFLEASFGVQPEMIGLSV